MISDSFEIETRRLFSYNSLVNGQWVLGQRLELKSPPMFHGLFNFVQIYNSRQFPTQGASLTYQPSQTQILTIVAVVDTPTFTALLEALNTNPGTCGFTYSANGDLGLQTQTFDVTLVAIVPWPMVTSALRGTLESRNREFLAGLPELQKIVSAI